MRKFDGEKLVIASHNKGKIREIGELMAPFGVEVVSASEMGVEEPEETGLTFIDNALLKAHHSAKATGLPALADDSGLAVDALEGAPGIYSARWGGPERDFNLAMNRVNEEMGQAADRGARFVCALALAWPDGHAEAFEGTVAGSITWPPRGEKGFGYDPIFTATGHQITFAEMEPAEKHAISHRADAFKKMVEGCFDPS